MRETLETMRETVDEDEIAARAAQRLVATLPDDVDRNEVETTVRERVRQLSANARVHTFVGVLAERQARELLNRRAGA